MGKIKRSRNKPRKSNPIRKQKKTTDCQDELIESDISPSELSVQAAKEQLQSPNQEDKLCGLQTLATLLETQEYENVLVEQSVVRVAAPLLVDDTPTVRNVTSGTLRNFSALGLDACEYLVGQDIMTPLIEFFRKYADNWAPKKTNTGKLDEDADTFLHCVNLLWNLCESSGSAVKYFNDSNIISTLTRCLDTEAFGNEMVTAVLHCLFVITEDNPKAINDLRGTGEESIRRLFYQQEETPVILLLRMLAAGLILNIQSNNIKLLPTEIVTKMMTAINATLSVDLRQSCNHISSVLPLVDAKSNPANHKKNQTVEIEVTQIKHLIDAQQIAVEIITNLCSCEDQDDDVMETDCVSDMDSDIEDENPSNCAANGSDDSYSFEHLPIEVSECIASNNLVAKILAKTILPPENVLKIFEESETGKHIYKRLCILQARSLLCMNNFISNLQLEVLGGPEGLYKIWIDTGKRIFKDQEPYNAEEIMESASAVMRASLDRLKNDLQESNGSFINNALIKELSLHDIKFLLEGIQGCTFPEIRANLTRMVGNVGLILVKGADSNSSDILLTITEFILDRMFKETECWLLAEVIDTVMDLFSEDETDLLAHQTGLISKLNAVKPTFKSKVRQQKKALGDHSAIVSTVVTNLPRFIDYKRKRIANIH